MAPGPKHLLRTLPLLVAPLVALAALFGVTKHYNFFHFPTWSIGLSCILIYPLIFYASCYVNRFIDWRFARSHGAVLPPLVTDSCFTVIPKLQESFTGGYPGKHEHDYMKRYGQNIIVFHFLGNKMVFTVEPHHIKELLATQFELFEKGTIMCEQFASVLGVGIFNTDGEMWKFHRTMTRPFFTRERISDFEIYARTADKSLDLAQTRLREGYSIDVQDLVGRFTLDSATEFLYGYSVDSLAAGIPYPKHSEHKNSPLFHEHASTHFVNAFDKGMHLIASRLAAGEDWPLFEFWEDQAATCRKKVDKFLEPIMKQALARREAEIEQNGGKTLEKKEEATLLGHLVNYTQDPKIIMDELTNLLVAGRDTTMSLLSFSLYMLIENPHVEHKLRQEIFEKVGTHHTPTYENMRDMKYTRAFLNEVLRLYPPVPFNARMTMKPSIFPAPKGSNEPPVYVSAGTLLSYSVFHMHQRTDLWGPDALTFDPDRFLDERLHKYLIPNPYIFCPFNAGPRICLGQQFAYHEATFYIVRLLQRFTNFKLDEEKGVNVRPPEEWKAIPGLQGRDRIVPHLSLTMSIKGGLWITMEELKLED